MILNFFYQLVNPYTPYDAEKPPSKGLFAFVGDYLRPFRRLIALNIGTATIVALSEVFLIFYIARLIDLLTTKSPTDFWTDHRSEVSAVVIFFLLLRPLLILVDTGLARVGIQPHLAALGRWRAHNHVLKQPLDWFQADFAGRIANRVVYTPASLAEMVYTSMSILAFSISYVVGSISLMGGLQWQLTLPLVMWLVLYALLLRWALVQIRSAAKRTSIARSKTLGYIVDAYTNIQSLKLFSHSDQEQAYMHRILEDHRHTYAAENRIFTQVEVRLALLSGILIVGLTGYAVYMWSISLVSVGVVAATGALVLRLNAMTGQIMQSLVGFFRALGVVSEGLETIAQPIQMKDQIPAKEFEFTTGQINISGLKHFFGADIVGLNGVNLDIHPGEKVGIVGRSGAGKSTLVKAVLRLYDPQKGSVVIDGQNVKYVTQDSLRQQIGMVSQETALLHRTIRENLLYGRPDASEAQMIAAAKQAQAHDFIAKLHDEAGRRGYDTMVGERGVKLSGGQRQRIALARVLLKNAPILILDEATSALDSEVEAEIQDSLYDMMEGKTVLAIAHRLSTIARMDRIIVMDDGKIVEIGTHEELLKLGKLYTNFWNHQTGGFIALD